MLATNTDLANKLCCLINVGTSDTNIVQNSEESYPPKTPKSYIHNIIQIKTKKTAKFQTSLVRKCARHGARNV